MLEKTEGLMKNEQPETQATLDTQDIGRTQTKQTNATQDRKKDEQHGLHQKQGVNPDGKQFLYP